MMGFCLKHKAVTFRHQYGHIIPKIFLQHSNKRIIKRHAKFNGTDMLPMGKNRNNPADSNAKPSFIQSQYGFFTFIDLNDGRTQAGKVITVLFWLMQTQKGSGRGKVELKLGKGLIRLSIFQK